MNGRRERNPRLASPFLPRHRDPVAYTLHAFRLKGNALVGKGGGHALLFCLLDAVGASIAAHTVVKVLAVIELVKGWAIHGQSVARGVLH